MLRSDKWKAAGNPSLSAFRQETDPAGLRTHRHLSVPAGPPQLYCSPPSQTARQGQLKRHPEHEFKMALQPLAR